MSEAVSAPGERRSALSRQIAGAATWLARARENGNAGPLAEIRRMARDPDRVPPATFWSIVGAIGADPMDEPFWGAILPLMAEVPHVRARHPGRACRDARVSAGRIERWLRLDREAARIEVRRFLRRLDRGVDWVELGLLLHEWSESARRRFARDYYIITRSTDGRRVVTQTGRND